MTKTASRLSPSVPSTVWMRPLPPATRLSFYGNAAARALAAAVWQAPFSEEPLRATTDGTRATLWLGPDEYLLLAAAEDPADLVQQRLDAALAAVPHALVDISHRQTGFALSGRLSASTLNAGCPLDLSIEAFPVGMCTRTVLGKAEIVLWRTAEEIFHVEVWRSFQRYTEELLREIARQ